MKRFVMNDKNMKWLRRAADQIESHMSASQIMMAGFAAAIFFGGFLLSLPFCNADGKWLNYLDALFTSCSAVCVTGLVTIVPATQFSLLGKVILLLLIQLGGLGIIVCTMGAFLILRKQITIRDRVIIQEGFNLNTMSGLVVMLRYVIHGTFLVEAVGALLYSIQFVPEFGLIRGIWYSVFHSISAFCNAGIDMLGESSLELYQVNPVVNLTTMGLIVVSGIGFIVWQDVVLTLQRIRKRKAERTDCQSAQGESGHPLSIRRCLQKMKLQSKLAIIMTLILLFGGALAVFCMEYSNPDTLGSLSLGQKWMAAMFQSVTTRTAGFFTVPQGLLREQTKLVSCILMFIGGSPGGTAGGVKTTTVAILLLTCWSVLKGTEDTECFRRKVLATTVRTAFSIFTVSFLAVLLGTMAIVSIEQVPLIDGLYEVVSAVGTVGLTTGITPGLKAASKMIIILLMYLGRIGPVTMAILFAAKLGRRKNGRKFPEERVMVG